MQNCMAMNMAIIGCVPEMIPKIRSNFHALKNSSINYILLLFFASADSIRERMCCAISAEAPGFAAFRALSDISAIRPSLPVAETI